MFLSVEQYNFWEKQGRRSLSNRFLEAFQPVTFNEAGFPTRIECDAEVFKYLDSMHDGRLKRYYEKEAYVPTHEEFEEIKKLSSEIFKFSKKNYGRGIIVKAPMLSGMDVVRKLKCLQISPGGGLPTVFEIGGGNGLLGAMLHNAGYSYISTDITQAFYLTQNNMWEGLFPHSTRECMDSLDNIEVNSKEIIHIPYWKLWELRNSDLEADVMVANHALAEMHPRALCFYLQYGKQLMRNSRYKLFITQYSGRTTLQNNITYLLKTFDTMGYALLYGQKDFAIFCLKDKQGVLTADMKVLLNEYKTSCYYPIFPNSQEQMVCKFCSEEQKMKSEQKVSLQEIEEYFASLDKRTDSPDEEFIRYCQSEA